MLACIILEIPDGTEVGNIYRIEVHPRYMTVVMVFFSILRAHVHNKVRCFWEKRRYKHIIEASPLRSLQLEVVCTTVLVNNSVKLDRPSLGNSCKICPLCNQGTSSMHIMKTFPTHCEIQFVSPFSGQRFSSSVESIELISRLGTLSTPSEILPRNSARCGKKWVKAYFIVARVV